MAIADMQDVRVQGDDLCFRIADDSLSLQLGADRAERWAMKIAAPPPSLARKLGVGPTSKALVIGEVEDAALAEALADSRAAGQEDARLSLAVVTDETTLERALRIHETLPHGTPIWIVHGKGPRAIFGEVAVRRFMREAGYRDNKVSGVSDALSATRYGRR
jgi:hypothetical protein